MNYCLPKELTQKFVKGLKDGSINPDNLNKMSSADRNSFFATLLGKDHATGVNELFESKLLLKNQQQGMIDWVKKVTGMTPEVKRDMITKIQNMDKILDAKSEETFLKDLASKKLGTEVTFEDAKAITELSKKITETGSKMDPKTGKFPSLKDRLDYGASRVQLNNLVNEMKLSNKTTKFQDFLSITKLSGIAKGIQASLDNSAIFRQGWKTVFTNPKIWGKNALKSFSDITKQIGRSAKNTEIIDGINADIQSRPNAINNYYKKAKLDVGVGEEAFPESLPEKIPVFNRLYVASETAYNGFLRRMRADIFDKYIDVATKNGVELTDVELRSIGKLTNSLTGRGDLGKLEQVGSTINSIFFSPKYLKSNIDMLLQPITGAGEGSFIENATGKTGSSFVRKQAAMNALKVIAGTASILATAKALNPDSVDFDPRSSDFGKIKIGATRFDVTGGAGSIYTLASRLIPTTHNGKTGFYTKSSTSGKFTALSTGKYGAKTMLDVAESFAENKSAPMASILIDYLKQQDFNGNKVTPQGEALKFVTPFPIKNAVELINNPDAAPALIGIIADAIGITTNSY